MKRLTGLLLIIRALAPILAVATILLAASLFVNSFEKAIQGPLSNLKTDVDDLGQTIDTAWQQFENATGPAAGSLRTLAAHLKAFALPTLVSKQLGALLGGLAAPMNSLFRGIEDMFRPFGDVLNSISTLGNSLQAIPRSVGNAISQGELLMNRLGSVVLRWSGLLVIAGVVILALVAIYNIASFVDDFARGWRMLFG